MPRSVAATIRKIGGAAIRRAGLLPGGVPDGLGEDRHLVGTSLPHAVMVYFPDAPTSIYQLRQWYEPLETLDGSHRVVVVLQDSRTAKLVRSESDLDVIVVARFGTLDDLLSRSDVKVALYVNNSDQNFSCLRFTSMVHAAVMHGDSDKAVTISHQIQAYDFSLVAGQAGVDRLAAHVPFFDAENRCMTIGRPQLDVGDRAIASGPRDRAPDQAPTALYAPTWEGSQPTASYSSVSTTGEQIVTDLVADGWRVIYRPHPLTGVRDRDGHGVADQHIREMLQSAGPPHDVDTGRPLVTTFAEADALVCDVSSLAVEWLPTRRPLMITRPPAAAAQVAATPLLDSVARIDSNNAAGTGSRLREALVDDGAAAARDDLVDYYLGDTSPGAATRRFVAAIGELITRRDAEQRRLTAVRDTASGR